MRHCLRGVASAFRVLAGSKAIWRAFTAMLCAQLSECAPVPLSRYDTSPLNFEKVRTYALATRRSKVSVREFAKPLAAGGSMRKFLTSLPRILAAEDLRAIVAAVQEARQRRRAILWGLGGHVIKVGLGPFVIDLIERGFVSAVAMNGAALVHDFEIALTGSTSEDVEAGIGGGEFGMAEETGRHINEIAKDAARRGIGLGESAGRFLTLGAARVGLHARFLPMSILAGAYRARIPVTVHLAIGTDIPHIHRTADGASLGTATFYDFRLFCALVKQMQPGGVYLNWGSAVILPEVFLKAVSVARNLGTPLSPITTANFDFIQHYRPLQNVVKRPTAGGKPREKSRGYAITGHHEIMLPLFASALRDGTKRSKTSSAKHFPRTKGPRKS